jgi:hypothetical protein
LNEPAELLSFITTLVMLLLNAYEDLEGRQVDVDEGGNDSDDAMTDVLIEHHGVLDMATVTTSTLHTYCLCHLFSFFNEDLGYWIKPRSTTWFTRFLMEQYDDEHWVETFRMSKAAILNLTDLLQPCIAKRDMRNCLAVPVVVRVAVILFKLA